MTLAWNLTLALACTWLAAVLAVRLRLRRPRVIPGDPRCAACGYLLIGNASGRCPECGRGLAGGGVRAGRTVRRLPLKFSLLAAVVGAVAFGARIAGQVDWYTFKPAPWVVEDAKSTQAAVAARAWRELERRQSTDELGPRTLDAMAELALREQELMAAGVAGRPIRNQLMSHLVARHDAGTLTPAQVDRLYRQAFRPVLRVPPFVAIGQPVTVELDYVGAVPIGNMLTAIVRAPTYSLDGGPPVRLPVQGTGFHSRGWERDVAVPRVAPATVKVRVREVRGFDLRSPEYFAPGEYPWTIETDLEAEVRVVNPIRP